MRCRTADKIKTEHILEKGSGRLNEDSLVIEENLFGVFDGASSLDNTLMKNGLTGGKIASQTAGFEFSKNHFPLAELGGRANKAIRLHMIDHNIDMTRRYNLWSTSAAVVRIKDDTLEWFQTGDAHIILFYEDGTFDVLADRDDQDYETLTMYKTQHFKLNRAFKNQIKKVRSRMNRSYGVLNGEPEALDFTQKGSNPLETVTSILLFTDGLNLPSTTPCPKKTFKRLAQCFRNKGLAGLRNTVRAMESQDPKITCYPRFKCHDDIAAIAIHL